MPRAARRAPRRAAKAKAKPKARSAAVGLAAVHRGEEAIEARLAAEDAAEDEAGDDEAGDASDDEDELEYDAETREIEEKRRARQSCAHTLMLMVLVLAYGSTIAMLDGDREMLSAAWREILGELRPDEAKDAERITEGEVVPKWAEFLHADDVTKQLNWFQRFCMFKHGMDDHLEFFWTCNIIKTELDWPEGTTPLAPHMNCSRDFVREHVLKGDDPRCVSWGENSLELLQRLESSQNGYASHVGKVNEVYDEFTVLEGNPMWETVDDGFEEVSERLQTIEELIAQHGPGKRRLDGTYVCQRPSSMRCPWRNVSDDREPADIPCGCFQYGQFSNGTSGWKAMRTCRNHHWGLMHLCKPSHIAVKFYIERVIYSAGETGRVKKPSSFISATKRRRRVLWFMVEMIFDDIAGGWKDWGSYQSSPSGWYRTYLNLQEGEFYGYKSLTEGLMGAITLVLLLLVLVREVVWTIVRLPVNLKKIFALRDSTVIDERFFREGGEDPPSLEDVRCIFEKLLLRLADGRGARRKHMRFSECCLENIISAVVLLGFVRSMADWNKAFIPLEYDSSESTSPRRYIFGKLHGWQIPTELIYELFFDDTAWHGLAWILLYFRTLFYFLRLLPGLRWIPVSMVLASVRSLYFLVAYGFTILGFGLLAYLQFGARFVQFSSVSRGCYELLFLSFGVPGYIFEDIFPFEDSGSWLASTFLALFVVVAVTLGLNFFTTIILDAYNIAINPESSKKVLDESWNTMCEMFMYYLGIPVHLYEEGIDDSPAIPDVESSLGYHVEQRLSEVQRNQAANILPRESILSEVELQEASLRDKGLSAG